MHKNTGRNAGSEFMRCRFGNSLQVCKNIIKTVFKNAKTIMTNTEYKLLQGIRKKNTIVLETDMPVLDIIPDCDLRYMVNVVIDYEKGKEKEHRFSLNLN
jgi:hypothetical protein